MSERALRLAVYCSSSSDMDEIYRQTARELGRLLGERGYALTFGGCDIGLMGELARAAKQAGAPILGVTLESFVQYGLAYAQADELIVVRTLAERKAIMEQRAEAFIALPGGFGTLDELAQVLTLKQLGSVKGAVVLLNTQGFYDHLLAHLERLYQASFAKRAFRTLYDVARDPAEALDYIARYQEVALPQKW